MLVLSRKEWTKVFLHNMQTGDTVVIDVIEIRCGPEPKVRLGFTAPEWVQIERDDVKQGAKPSQQNIQRPEED